MNQLSAVATRSALRNTCKAIRVAPFTPIDIFPALDEETFYARLCRILGAMASKPFNRIINREMLVVFILYTFSHALFLIHNGIFVDDWYNQLVGKEAFLYHNLSGGRPWFGYAVVPIFPLENIFSFNIIYFHRLFIFFCYFGAAFFFNRILKNISEIEPQARLALTLIFALLPYFQARIFVSMWPYSFCYFIFFFAFSLLPHREKTGYRVASIFLFCVSFLVQSFIAFYILILVFFAYENKTQVKAILDGSNKIKGSFLLFKSWAVKYPDFVFLPIVVWFVQRSLYQPFGDFAYYNAFSKWTILVKAPYNLLMTFVLTPLELLTVPLLYIRDSSPFLLILMFPAGWFLYSSLKQKGEPQPTTGINRWFLLFGLFAFFFGIFPYAAVNKEIPSLLDWSNKTLLLLPVGVSFLLYYGTQAVYRGLAAKNFFAAFIFKPAFFISALLALCINYNIGTWLEFHVGWFKQLSLVEHYRSNNAIRDIDAFIVLDYSMDLNAKNRHDFIYYEYMGPMRIAYPDKITFAVQADVFDSKQRGKDELVHYFTKGGFRHPKTEFRLKGFLLEKPYHYLKITEGSLDVNGLWDVLSLKLLQHTDREKFKRKIIDVVNIEVLVEKDEILTVDLKLPFKEQIKNRIKEFINWDKLRATYDPYYSY